MRSRIVGSCMVVVVLVQFCCFYLAFAMTCVSASLPPHAHSPDTFYSKLTGVLSGWPSNRLKHLLLLMAPHSLFVRFHLAAKNNATRALHAGGLFTLSLLLHFFLIDLQRQAFQAVAFCAPLAAVSKYSSHCQGLTYPGLEMA